MLHLALFGLWPGCHPLPASGQNAELGKVGRFESSTGNPVPCSSGEAERGCVEKLGARWAAGPPCMYGWAACAVHTGNCS